jgi:enoyl-CoA hydratase/carnithine racemase
MTEDVLFEKKGGVGWITLNRPKALNALNYDMIGAMDHTLHLWETDPEVKIVLLKGAGEKGLCAGGDIRSLYESVKSGSSAHHQFFKEEYALNEYIYSYPKPYIAVMDGIVMGGGMGISQGAQFRIVTERSKIAMPEVAIGFFPDVGASHFLKQCPGHIANYLAITGLTVGPEDAIYANLADCHLASEHLDSFYQAIQNQTRENTPVQLKEILLSLGARFVPQKASLQERAELIETVFSLPTVLSMVRNLETRADSISQEVLQVMKKRSPLSMVGTHELLKKGKQLSITQCFDFELALGTQWFVLGDFVEGVRSVIIDKDHAPKWAYSLAELSHEKLAELIPLFKK